MPTFERDSGRVIPNWGRQLSDSDYVTLEGSWITRGLADAAMLRRVTEQEGRDVVGQKGKRDCAGILIPYLWPGEPLPHAYRIRRDHPDVTADENGRIKLERKYLAAPGSGNRLYIPPGVTLEQLNDVCIPIVLVEGEKKALALWRLANHGVSSPRFIPIAISGVWNWRGIVGKTGGAGGERLDVKGPIPDLGRIAWTGRKIFIIFDTNVNTDDSVKWARNGIARELAIRQGEVQFVNLPADCGVNGVDDLLVAWGPTRVLELFETPVAAANITVVLPPQFQMRPEGMFRITQKGGLLTEIQLTNFRASVVTNVTVDDGVETQREFEIESELMGHSSRFTIAASVFASMDWPIERMGCSRDHIS